MKNILVIADGLPAKHFVDRISGTKRDSNHYTIVIAGELEEPEYTQSYIKYHRFDPTSRSKIKDLMFRVDFDSVFIILDDLEESIETYTNIRIVNEKIKIFMLDYWDVFDDNEDEYLYPLNINLQISNRLYDQLPDVPRVAQNVGLASGEIMEVYVPSGSPFAHRHVGSISQVKWSIAAIFRQGKLILPKPHEMIRAEDTLLLIGQPKMLSTIYRRISKQSLKIPEPFGRNFYLLLDLSRDDINAISQIQEAIYLLDEIDNRELIIRVLNPSGFEVLDEIRAFAKENINVLVEYESHDIASIMLSDLQLYNIGMVMTTLETLSCDDVRAEIYSRNKLLYIFGDVPLYNIHKSIILVTDEEQMESISSTSIYISKDLGLDMCLCSFDPEGEHEEKKNIIMHYEAISEATQYPIEIIKKNTNPIREMSLMNNILQIAPMSKNLKTSSVMSRFSTDISDYILRDSSYPKILIPIS